MTPEELAERIKASADPEQAYELMAAQPMRARQAAHHALPLASRLALWEVQFDRFAEDEVLRSAWAPILGHRPELRSRAAADAGRPVQGGRSGKEPQRPGGPESPLGTVLQ